MFDDLWVEKYRPKTLDQIVLSENNRRIFEKFAAEKTIPNLLFAGTAGIGKTSLAKILCKSILECQYLYINASDENGIDTIRTKVTNFSKTKSLDGNIKVIILDEVDGLTLDAQRALRNTMEEYSEFVRFILTANYNHRVIPALQSRCQSLDITPTVDGYIDRCFDVIERESCVVESSDTEQLKENLRQLYPDLRKAINEIQKNVFDNKVSVSKIKISEKLIENIYSLVQRGLVLKLRKIVIENENRFNGDYSNLLKLLFNHVYNADIQDDVKRLQLIAISEHMYRSSFVSDPEINFYSCLLAISK